MISGTVSMLLGNSGTCTGYKGRACSQIPFSSVITGRENWIRFSNSDLKLAGKAFSLQNVWIPERAGCIGSESIQRKKLWRGWRSGYSNASSPNVKQRETVEACSAPAQVTLETTLPKTESHSHKHEKLWRDLFSDPSKWWDNRLRKETPKFPDFKNKMTGDVLWLDNRETPAWVKSDIAALKTHSDEEQWVKSQIAALTRPNHYRRWQSLFSEPSQWWDNRSRKIHAQYPDFKHKVTGEGLWLDRRGTPGWVASKIASLGPGTLELHVISSVQTLSRYNKAGQYSKTMELFRLMQQRGISADHYIFLHVLRACAALGNLEVGRRIHKQIFEASCELNPYVSNSLVNMYARCGSLDDARNMFEKITRRNVVSWNAIIKGCAMCGREQEALELFQRMQEEAVEPNNVTFLTLLNACASMAALEDGKRLHKQILESGCEADVLIGSALVDFYAKCGSLEDARSMLDKMPTRNLASWRALILGHVKGGHVLEALDLFQEMRREGIEADSATFVLLLDLCASIGALEQGRKLHEQIIRSKVYVGNSLVKFYVKCESLEEAQRIFNRMPSHDVGLYNMIIQGYEKCGQLLKVLEVYQQMQGEGVKPDSITLTYLLKTCASLGALEEGRRLHEQILQLGCESNVHVSSSLVDMYAKCGSLEDAQSVFHKIPTHNVVSWTAMMMGFAIHGLAKEAVSLFEQKSLSGLKPNQVTFICVLLACSYGGLVQEGFHYFDCMQSVHGITPIQEHYTCMVDMLGRAGNLDDAEDLIMKTSLEPCAGTWMSLLGACKFHGDSEMGQRAEKQVRKLHPVNPAGYVQLSNIHAGATNFEGSDVVQELRVQQSVMTQPGRTWIEVHNQVHSFVVDDREHPQIVQIYEELTRLSDQITEVGYVPNVQFALHDAIEEKKVDHLWCHSEKLAIAFGLINTPAGSSLRIVKNLRVCGDCHTTMKFVSRVTGRSISVRDPNRFHHFKDGCCSCGDYW